MAEAPADTLVVDPVSGVATISLIAGANRITIRPDFPYAKRELDSLMVPAAEETMLELGFTHPLILLVDADTIETRSIYYETPLSQLDVECFNWRRADMGAISNRTPGFQTVVYYTGNKTVETIPEADQVELRNFIEAGGSLLVTGQNISDDLAGSDFLTEVLHAGHQHDNVRSYQVLGIENDPVLSGKTLLLVGNQGAANQNSPASIIALGDASPMGFYANRGETVAAVRWALPGGGRGIFCAFGVEGISGQGGTTTREEFLRSALTWLGTPLSIESDLEAKPLQTKDLVSVWPNPFNDQVRISVNWLGSDPQRLCIYDHNGRVVTELESSGIGRYWWDGKNQNGTSVATGVYFVGVEGKSGMVGSTKLVYIR